ncbi:MAG: polysaccharide biosynthesis tyrosine autokinase [Cyanobacteria bacterium P01_A01_bin.116]
MEIPNTFIVRQPTGTQASDDLDFAAYWQAVKRRFVPAAGVGASVIALSIVAIALQRPAYESAGKLLIRPDKTPSLTGLSPDGTREFEPITVQSNPLKTEIEVLQSQPLLEKVIARLNLQDAEGQPPTPTAVAAQLDVEVSGGTDVIKVLYSSDDPELSAAMANTIMELYIENNIELNQAEAAAASEFIAKELPSAEADVRRAEIALSRFKQANELVAIDEEASSAVEFVTDLDGQIAVAQSQLANTNARLGGLQSQLNLSSSQALNLSAVSQSTGVQEALADLQAVETQLVEARSFFNDNSPQVIDLRGKASALQSLLRSRVGQVIGSGSTRTLQIGDLEQSLIESLVDLEVQRLGLGNQIEALDRARGSYEQRMNDLPELARQQTLLERELNAVQTTYETLLTNLQELKTTGNQALGNARIIEPATPPNSPALNKKALALGLGGLMASVAAFAATILFLEGCDRTVKSLDELKRLYNCDVLEALPQLGKKEASTPIMVRDQPRSLTSEIYRSLQIKLQYFNDVRAFKTVTVVSATPDEGAATVAANLAMAHAELQQKILLIDGNLRGPQQSALWNLPANGSGLSHVLQGKKSLQLSIHQVHSHLWVLPAGPEPTSPLALLRSAKMQALLKAAAKSFDAIIIDSPALLAAPDGLVLGKLSDGLVVVSKLGKVERSHIATANDALKKSHQSVLGLVATNTSNKEQIGDRWLYESSADALAGSKGYAGSAIEPSMELLTTPSARAGDSRGDIKSDYSSADFATKEDSRSSPVIQLEAKNTFDNADGAIGNGFLDSSFLSNNLTDNPHSSNGNGSNGNGSSNSNGNGNNRQSNGNNGNNGNNKN